MEPTEYIDKDLPKCYQGHMGTLLWIADLCWGYDGRDTVEGLKYLIDEVRKIALDQIGKSSE